MTTLVRLLLIPCVLVSTVLAVSQQRGTPVPPTSTTGQGYDPAKIGSPIGRTDDDGFAIDPSVMHRREEARKLERKKRMVDSANRLLVLSQQLQADLKGREATPDDQKKLDEIAKLARQVKDQMRN